MKKKVYRRRYRINDDPNAKIIEIKKVDINKIKDYKNKIKSDK